MIRPCLGAVLIVATVVSCGKPRTTGRRAVPTAAPRASATAAATAAPETSAPAPAAASASAAGSASAAAAGPSGSASAPPAPAGNACRVDRGPIQLAYTGPVTLVLEPGAPADQDPRIVFNRDGLPASVTLPPPPKAPDPPKKPGKAPVIDWGSARTSRALPQTPEAKKPERLALAGPAEQASSPGCAAAGGFLFCVDKSGGIHRVALSGEGATVVATGRPSGPIAAAPIGGSHVVYAFLAARYTTEGATSIAFAGYDDQTPVTLSEDGSGATFVTVGARGDEVVAMYIDARRMLTPVHARVLKAGPKLALGDDAVLFVGDGTDGWTPGALALGAPGNEFALVPTHKDDKSFGLAAIRIEDKPRDDATVAWSLDPAGLDRAPIAATQGSYPIRVLRVRAASAEDKPKRVLELGEVDASGAHRSLCTVAEGSSFKDLAILADRAGGLWIAYTDGDGTWIERRGRP
jgi:hypothetical protein